MNKQETVVLILFLLFWASLYLHELKFLLSAIKNRSWKSSKAALPLHAIAMIGILFLLYGYFFEPYWLAVNHVLLRTPKLKNTSFTVVQISDLHCDQKIRNEKKLVAIINRIKPDIIVFTGDAVNDPRALGLFKGTLRDLNASLGKFAVKGNWDVWIDDQDGLFNDTGFQEVNGRLVRVEKNGEVVFLTGLNSGSGPENLSFSEKDLKDSYSMLLCHYPGIHEELKAPSFDLYLSGHTHGGQVSLPVYGALITLSKYGKKYASGKYQDGTKTIYVHNGVGMEGGHAPRIRLFSRPEIAVFQISPLDKH